MDSFFSFDMVQSGLVIAALFAAGEWISKRMKAAIPGFLAAGVLFVALLWSGVLPGDLVARSGLNSLVSIAIMFVILNMGSTTNFRELAASWRVVVLSALSYAFELGMIFLSSGRSLAGISPWLRSRVEVPSLSWYRSGPAHWAMTSAS